MLANSILKRHIEANLDSIEILITEKNRGHMLRLYRDYTRMNLNPNIEERSGFFYMVIDIKSKKSGKIIDIQNMKNNIIEVDFNSRQVVGRV